jgi:hypothetical protein
MLSNIDSLQTTSESKLEKLWKDFQITLQEYMTSTEAKRNQYAKLKARDEIATDIIAKHNKTITSLSVSLLHYLTDSQIPFSLL